MDPIQKLNLFVPEIYYHDGCINGYTSDTSEYISRFYSLFLKQDPPDFISFGLYSYEVGIVDGKITATGDGSVHF